jgi:S-adenosylmethionine:tRNA ribosyltransferase-isomerase
MSFLTADYFFDLPEGFIAQEPANPRDASRLFVYDRQTQKINHQKFKNLLDYLNPGDLLVFNNTKVIPARLWGVKLPPTHTLPHLRGGGIKGRGNGAKIEILLLKPAGQNKFEALVRPANKIKKGHAITIQNFEVTVIDVLENGNRILDFGNQNPWDVMEQLGEMPLPPYILSPGFTSRTEGKPRAKDKLKTDYQTVYAKEPGAVAAPTAGLHFTSEVFEKLKTKGIQTAELTLHVGVGTFRPVSVDDIREHNMHAESYVLSAETVELIQKTKQAGGRVIAVGTTVVRVLESVFKKFGELKADQGETNIFIYPPYQFKVIDGLLTNFHLPGSTLLMLVSALIDAEGGREKILKLYQEAIKEKYRFFSFGDAMLIL